MRRYLFSILQTAAFLDPSPGVAAIVNYQGFLIETFFPGFPGLERKPLRFVE
jgi:hypothetical protein